MGRGQKNKNNKARAKWLRKQAKAKIKSAKAGIVDASDTMPWMSRSWKPEVEKDATKFSLKIPDKIFEKIMYWIDKCSPNEVSGFGTLEFDEATREFKVTDAYLLEQEVSGGSAEIDDRAIAKMMFQKRNEDNALKWHWHSHPTFSVFWSGTDMELIKQLGRQGWIVATVLNCKRESRTAFLTSVDVMGKPHDIFVDDFPMEIVSQPDAALQRQFDEEFDANVKRQSSSTYYSGGKSNYERNYDNIYDRDENKRDYKPHLGIAPSAVTTKKELPKKIKKSDYDSYGYTQDENMDYVYNPMYDEVVIGRTEQFMAIDEMEQHEIAHLRERDNDFDNLVRDYIIAKAKGERYNYAEDGVVE